MTDERADRLITEITRLTRAIEAATLGYSGCSGDFHEAAYGGWISYEHCRAGRCPFCHRPPAAPRDRP